MRILNRVILESVVIFDKKDLSVNGLGTVKYQGTFSLQDFIIKDRTSVINAQLVLFDDGHSLKFVKSNIGEKVECYNNYNKHINEMNKLQIAEIAELKKKNDEQKIILPEIIIDDDVENDCELDEITVSDTEGLISMHIKKKENKNEQRNKTVKGNKKVRKRKNTSNSSWTAGRIKRK